MTEPAQPDPPPKPRRRLDARTVGICVCIAVIAALVAGLIANAVTGNDHKSSSNDHLSLASDRIDSSKLLAVSLLTSTGAKTTLGDQLAAKPALVNMWQQSCTPCVEEMPLLEQVHQTDKRVDVIGLDVQDRPDMARQMVRQTKITYPWLQDRDGNAFYEAKGVALPRSVLIGADGKVLAVKTGDFKSVSEIRSWISDHLA